MFRAFGCSGAAVTGSGSLDAAAEGLSWAADIGSLEKLMHASDVVVVSAPLTERTTGMIGTEQLRALGADGVLINVGRGPLVAERPLYEALSARAIAGAAIDVGYADPNADGNACPSELAFGQVAEPSDDPSFVGGHREHVRRQSDDRRQHRRAWRAESRY